MGIGRDIAYAVGALVSAPFWGTSLLRTGKWRTDWRGRLGCPADAPPPADAQDADEAPSPPPAQSGEGRNEPGGGGRSKRRAGGATLLIHAVSVGEVNLIRRLVTELCEPLNPPDADLSPLNVVVSTTTNTGFTRATRLYGDAHRVVRYPLDFSGAVRRFLDAVQPDAVALVELEVWPNFVEACARRGVPVAVINGRLSERSFKRYHLVRPVLRPTFAKLAAAAVQTQAYARRFEAMGVPKQRVRVLDTMKWDAASLADQVEGADAMAAALGIDRDKPVVVLGSSAPGEEVILRRALAHGDALAKRLGGLEEWGGRGERGVQVLVVPRKPEWFHQAAWNLAGCIRRSRHPDGTTRPPDAQRTFLIDTMGELMKAYALADVAVVGRSFGDLYGSNPLEPISLGRATVIGWAHRDFQEIVDALRAGGGIEVISNEQGRGGHRLGELLYALLADPARRKGLGEGGRAVIRARQGATRRQAALLRDVLDQGQPPRPSSPRGRRMTGDAQQPDATL